MKWLVIFSLGLLSQASCSLAYPNGAPQDACPDLMPRHGGTQSMDGNDGFFLMGDVVIDGSYVPGQSYQSKRAAMGRISVLLLPERDLCKYEA